MEEKNPLVGKVVTAVHLADDGGAIRFDVVGGEQIVARADGDCCSRTWIETVDSPERLIGAPVLTVEDIGGMQDPVEEDDETIQFYGCKITTKQGDVVIDYRNSSNGYYGGNLSWLHAECGVHGQNVSKEKWRQIAGPGASRQIVLR